MRTCISDEAEGLADGAGHVGGRRHNHLEAHAKEAPLAALRAAAAAGEEAAHLPACGAEKVGRRARRCRGR